MTMQQFCLLSGLIAKLMIHFTPGSIIDTKMTHNRNYILEKYMQKTRCDTFRTIKYQSPITPAKTF